MAWPTPASFTFGSITSRYLPYDDFLSCSFCPSVFSKLREPCFWYVLSLHDYSTFLFLEFQEDLANHSRTLATATFFEDFLGNSTDLLSTCRMPKSSRTPGQTRAALDGLTTVYKKKQAAQFHCTFGPIKLHGIRATRSWVNIYNI